MDKKYYATMAEREAIISTITERINNAKIEHDTTLLLQKNRDKIPNIVDYLLTKKPYVTYSGYSGWNDNPKGCGINTIFADTGTITGLDNIIAFQKEQYPDVTELVIEETAHNIFCEVDRYYRCKLMSMKHEDKHFTAILQ